MTPCFAYMTLWMILPQNLAKQALAKAALIRSNKAADTTTSNILDVVGEEGWKIQEGARLTAAYAFVSAQRAAIGIGADLA